LRGACDDLIAPRSFGPLHDAARGTTGPLAAAVAAGADRDAVFDAVFAELDASGGPVVLVVEDLHWADDATLDWLRYLARRIARRRALIIASYRDDELAADGSARSDRAARNAHGRPAHVRAAAVAGGGAAARRGLRRQ
jgi:hypothetical protein